MPLLQKNNGQRRRARAEEQKVKGNTWFPANKGANRAEKRALQMTVIACTACGEKIVFRNLREHVRKAMLHTDMAKDMAKGA